ncbi:MAG: WD40/YVTN/BNR-like repeat-containing protein [Candidatus Sulfotelmatobacter sp.]
MKRSVSVLVLVFLGMSFALAQAPRAATATLQPKFKAIWEPVNYKEDLTLFDVRFVSKDEGWATGSAGTILHTKDGGNDWTAELGGDPHTEGGDLKYGFIKDSKHGWAQAWNTLFRTTDGESWQQVTGDIRGNAVFVSDLKGFRAYGGKIFATQDGGIHWKEVFTCRAKMEVQGLTHETGCDLWVLSFPTAMVGYAMGDARVTAKTEDGGATWKVLVGPEEEGDQRVYNAFFLDANTGYQLRNYMLYRTTDGGQSWLGVIAKLDSGYPTIKFVDREVGWSIHGGTWAYTVDGGKHWTSRAIQFPAPVNAFSLPARDRGYVVGQHGMIYRYRVVPIDYKSKGMMEAPMMPEASATQSSPE